MARRGGATIPPAPEIDDEHDSLVMSIKLKSGRFESSLEIPLFSTDGEKKAAVEAWLNMMDAGVRCGHEYRMRKAAEAKAAKEATCTSDQE